jgi:hypothetical protein
MLKVFVSAFRCGRFLSLVFMLKVIALILGCSKFVLLVSGVESSCSYSWILKVFTLFLNVEGFYSYS